MDSMRVCVASHHSSFHGLLTDVEFERVRSDERCLIELRVDNYTDASVDALRQALRKIGAARCVVTCRHDEEGGGGKVPSDARASLFEAACLEHAAFVDVELRTLRQEPGQAALLKALGTRTQLIVSSHDFAQMPNLEALRDLCHEAQARGADVVKLAAHAADGIDDTVVLAQLMQEPPVPLPIIAIAMGEAGMWTRLLAPRFKSKAPFTYARASNAPGTAPGQPTWDVLLDAYRYTEQGADWPVYGVIGSPIAQSRSPALHNAALRALDLPGVYLPFRVDGPLDTFMNTLVPALGVRGLSVTLPHKEAVQAFCDECSPLAKRIGAVNTLVRTGDGTWRGDNTDADAAADALESAIGALRDQRVVLLGAGGAAKAVAHAVAARGADILVCNRSESRGRALADAVGGHTIATDALGLLQDIAALVQTTPVGMYPHTQVAPLTPEQMPHGACIFDTIYNPPITLLMQQAQARGQKTLGGATMFIRQAAAQFIQFTGKTLPLQRWEALFDEV